MGYAWMPEGPGECKRLLPAACHDLSAIGLALADSIEELQANDRLLSGGSPQVFGDS